MTHENLHVVYLTIGKLLNACGWYFTNCCAVLRESFTTIGFNERGLLGPGRVGCCDCCGLPPIALESISEQDLSCSLEGRAL